MSDVGRITPDELPAGRDDLEDLIRGRQIVHLWIDGPENVGFIRGVPCIAWELDNGDVHVMAAFPDVTPSSPFVYRVMWRMITGPAFMKKSKAPYYSIGRPHADLSDPQRKTRGQMIARAYREKNPGREGGEIIVLELTDGRRAIVEGVHTDDEAAQFANAPIAGMEIRIEEPERTHSLPIAAPADGYPVMDTTTPIPEAA